ncbi:exodeoxyribonuclease VII large subunit, partial [Pseudomonas sp. BIS1]|uniref:exodeoxyribonuclease VII large subunit n=1 Tax=Pseudomonas sp. BIS1 TaxID=2807722 RepID=UPI0023B06EDE
LGPRPPPPPPPRRRPPPRPPPGPAPAREVLKDRRQRLEGLAQTLNVVSPLATLGRGYSILLDERGRAIRDAGQTQPGQRLKARLAEGELEVRVEDNHRTPVTLSLLD